MQILSAAVILSALSLVAVQTTLVPDMPITFYGRLFSSSSECGGSAKAYLGSAGNCVNIPTVRGGSGIMVIGETSVNFLSAWTVKDYTGQVVAVQSSVGTCQDLGGIDIRSWSNDKKPFGG